MFKKNLFQSFILIFQVFGLFFLTACGQGSSNSNAEQQPVFEQVISEQSTSNEGQNQNTQNSNQSEDIEAFLKNLQVNQSVQLSISISPATADQSVTWSSDNPNIARLSSDGFLTAVSEGSTTISVVSNSNPLLKADYEVIVFANPVQFDENIHNSLSLAWQNEYTLIHANLSQLIPIYKSYYDSVSVYAWNDKVSDPYENVEGGNYVKINEEGVRLVHEIPESYFVNEFIQRYSVIVHEYFHLYQLSLNPFLGENLKWFVEGGASVFESLYVREFYQINNFTVHRMISDKLNEDPSLFESKDSNEFEINYGSSVFMFLLLSKELQARGDSETLAFQKLFKYFFLSPANQDNWQLIFNEIFGFSVESFYDLVKNHPKQIDLVLPSNDLTLDTIFNP